MNRKFWYTLVVVAGAVTGVVMSLTPWKVFSEQSRQTKAMVSDMQSTESERARLTAEKAHLESPLGRETTLRKKGYLRKGEIPIEVVD